MNYDLYREVINKYEDLVTIAKAKRVLDHVRQWPSCYAYIDTVAEEEEKTNTDADRQHTAQLTDNLSSGSKPTNYSTRS
jgi:hypothetical protein